MLTMSRIKYGNEENIPLLEKNTGKCNSVRSLPPNVCGQSSGLLDLCFDKVQWNVTNYSDLSARVVWWGESYDNATCIDLPSSSVHNRIQYSICTNSQLFRNYLASCEAIEVQFSTGNSRRQLGTAFISIPEHLFHPSTGAVQVHTTTHKIFSPRNHKVGLLKVTMKVVLFDDLTKGDDPLSEKNEDRRCSVKDYLNYTNKKKTTTIRSDSAMSSSSKVWSFLRGREMSPGDEARTLRELTIASPADSVIETMDEELTWKLREFRAKQRNNETFTCHNPSGGSGGGGGGGRKQHSPAEKDTSNNSTQTPNSNGSRRGGRGTEEPEREKERNGNNDPTQPEEKPPLDTHTDEHYQGVFYVGSFRLQNPHTRCPSNVFAMTKSVSNVEGQDGLMKTHLSDPHLFINYLKVFPVYIEESHLETQMKQGTLTVELWTRRPTEEDEKLGTVAVGVHPFYVAFRHDIVRQRLFDLSMPVIALDGWAMVQGPDGASIGELELVLAMGTKRQVEYFVQTKHLLQRQPPATPTSSSSSRSTEATSILSSFLDNLSQQIAASKARQEQTTGSGCDPPKRGELRKTSDLLDVLQKSLSSPVPPQMMNSLFAKPAVVAETSETSPETTTTSRDATDFQRKDENVEFVKICLEIECAMHLPKVAVATRDVSSRSGSKRAVDQENNDQDEEPSAYVTFEARVLEENLPEIVESVEGKVYTTEVVERSSNPVWNRKFTVEIPKDLLTHQEKYFIVKIWRKRGVEEGVLKPAPMADVVIGFCTVDLKVLTAGLPEIAGCYNIVYFDGRCHGQLQIKLKPLEAIAHLDVLDRAEMHGKAVEALPMLDLSIGADMSLSRTLKRKFTELDEITERLRARLHNVTSSELISSDDDFENDLNTSVDEVDVEGDLLQQQQQQQQGDVVDAVKDDFNWLGNLTEMQRQFMEIDRQLQSNSQTLNELLDRNGFQAAVAGPSGTQSVNNLYTNGGGGDSNASSSTFVAVESLETALKDAVLSDRSEGPPPPM